MLNRYSPNVVVSLIKYVCYLSINSVRTNVRHYALMYGNMLKNLLERGMWLFLSTPVHMHGGLLCVAFCLSVCLSVVT